VTVRIENVTVRPKSTIILNGTKHSVSELKFPYCQGDRIEVIVLPVENDVKWSMDCVLYGDDKLVHKDSARIRPGGDFDNQYLVG